MWSLMEDEGWSIFLWCPLPKGRMVTLWPFSFSLVGLCWFGQSSESLPLSGLFCKHTRSCLSLCLKTLTLETLIHCARSPATSLRRWEWRRAFQLSSGTCTCNQAPDVTDAIVASALHPPAVSHQCPMMAWWRRRIAHSVPGQIPGLCICHGFASQVALVVKNPPGIAGDIRDEGLVPGSGRSPGRVNGNPLQFSCLENPMDRGAWWATVHGVAKSDLAFMFVI